MAKLHPDWVTEGHIDLEYKKYLLLGYLQAVSAHFSEERLYPFLSDLVFHYRNLVAIRENHQRTREQFPRQLSRLDFEEFRVEYERMVQDSDYMDIIADILEFAIPRIQNQLGQGREIYEQVEAQMRIEPIGLVPIDTSMGYFFLHAEPLPEANVYEYEVSIFDNSGDPYRGIRTRFIETVALGITQTFERYKLELLKARREWPNPAAWLVSSAALMPIQETLLPVAKRRLVRHLGEAGFRFLPPGRA
jgi:hypothetical protein